MRLSGVVRERRSPVEVIKRCVGQTRTPVPAGHEGRNRQLWHRAGPIVAGRGRTQSGRGAVGSPKWNVLPLDDRSIEHFNAAIAGRPDLMGSRTSFTLFPGMTGMMENVFINSKNRSKTITAEVEILQSGANGVLLAQGGRFGGWSLYMKDGKPTYTYNWVGLERYTVAASEPLAAGKATIKLDFIYDGGGSGKGGTASLSVNGKKVSGAASADQRIPHLDRRSADVGEDDHPPVSEDYVAGMKSRFTGKIEKVTIDVK